MSATVEEIEQGRIGESESNHTKTYSELPQGLKPGVQADSCGTAEAVPFQKTAGEAESVSPTLSPTEGDKGGAPGILTRDDKSVEDADLDQDDEELEGEEEGPELTDEKAAEISAFILQDPPSEVPNTAQEKRLAAKRQKIEDQLGVMHQIGALINNPVKKFRFVEGGKTYKVSVRELLMRKHLKIRNKNGRLVQFKVNAAQRDYAKTAAKKNIVLKARQLGFTTYVAARFFLNCIARPGTVCVQVAHDQHSAEQIFRIVHRMLANLPDYLRRGVLATSHANRRQIIFPYIDSSYMVETANENAGRGLTIHNLHCSEVARWPGDAAATLAALRAAVPPDGEIVLESTANGACGCFYDEWLHAEEKGYSRHFYPWWWERSYKRPVVGVLEFTEEELELQMKFGLTAEQIAFRREIKATLASRAAEEYAEDAESCFRASGECYFDLGVVEQRLHNVETAVVQTDSGRTLTFYPAQPSKEYIIGVDPAGGGAAGDYSCAQVIDRASGMQVCELRGHLGPQELASRVAMLAREYNDAEVAVERNNHGHAVHAYLGHYAADIRVYHQKGQAGWLTNAASRPWMLDNLAAVLISAPYLFSSKRLLEELKTFVKRPDGSSAAANGAHDDTVMAMAIAQVVRTQGAAKVKAPEVGVLARSS